MKRHVEISFVFVVALCGCHAILPLHQAAEADAPHGDVDQDLDLGAPPLDLTPGIDLPAPYDLSPFDMSPPDVQTPDLGPPFNVWVKVLAGTFVIGSAASEPCRYTYEYQRSVTLTRSFEIQATEVTQAQFTALMGFNPSTKCTDPACPVQQVSWHEAAAYCNALSAKHTGMPSCYACAGSGASVNCTEAVAFSKEKVYTCPGFRLPTNAEWEYAARAGTTTPYHSGANDPALCDLCQPLDTNLDPIAWYCGNASGSPHPVATKQKNPWGLYDTAGNLAEWCHDSQPKVGTTPVVDPWNTGTTRVYRGGGYTHQPKMHRSAMRSTTMPEARYFFVGFRCVRTLP